MSTRPPLATVLPQHLAERLRNASKWPGEFERLKAIEQVTRQIKLAHPEYFRKEAL